MNAYHPHSAVILAVDTAKNSGWSLWSCGVRLDSGEVKADDSEAVEAICAAANKHAERELPKVIVLEKPYGGTLRTVDGLALRRGMWLRSWQRVCDRPRHKVDVYPQTWRAAFKLKGKVMPEYQRATLAAYGVNLHRQPGSDEFEALMIGLWSLRAEKVGSLIPRKFRGAA